MDDVVIVSGVRTAVGRFGSAFADVSASDLGAAVVKEAVKRANLPPERIDEVIMGCCGQVGEDAYVARHAAIKAGIPIETPAYTVNRLCGSGLESIINAARWIETGDAEVMVAGGTENMSRLPYYLFGVRQGLRMGNAPLEDAIPILLSDPFNRYHMGITAENLAKKFDLSRDDQDAFAVESHRRATSAIGEGRFKEQIIPVSVPAGRGETRIVDTDEHPRADTTMDSLSRLRPAFSREGCVTAGNASGINDGAAAVVVMSSAKAAQLGVQPRLRLVGRAVAGVDPALMGSGPIPAIQKLLSKTGVKLADVDVIELNEAFASVALACSQALHLDASRTNPNGGAVAIGHPVGATGTILTVKLMYELERIEGRYGIVSLCIGGGQGIAALFERIAA